MARFTIVSNGDMSYAARGTVSREAAIFEARGAAICSKACRRRRKTRLQKHRRRSGVPVSPRAARVLDVMRIARSEAIASRPNASGRNVDRWLEGRN